MREADAQAVLLVRAFETSDPEGRVLPLAERARATDASRLAAGADAGEQGEAVLARRAQALLPALERRVPGLPGLLRATRLGAGFAPWIAPACLALGLASNALGPSHRIGVLQWGLIALVAWNLVVYAAFLLLGLRSRRASGPSSAGRGGAGRRGGGIANRWLEATIGRFVSRARKQQAQDAGIVSTALGHFAADWKDAVMPLLASRVRLALHLGSLSLAVGVVAGMYVRGLGFKYEATWESTFLDADGMRNLLRVVLGPAAALLGRPIPDVAGMEAPSHGHAAPWIHLYAATAFLFVVAPRLVLALLEARTASRLSANLPIDVGVGYAARSGAAPTLSGVRVEVLPYGYHPPPRARDALKAVLLDVLGPRAEVAWRDVVEYGSDDAGSTAVTGGEKIGRVVLVSASQTPEEEVHGRFLREERKKLRPADRLVVVADASAMRERGAEPARVEERQRLWAREANAAGAACIALDLLAATGPGEGDARAESLARALADGPMGRDA